MKKIKTILISAIIIGTTLTGCSMTEDLDNTPTKKVENYLNKFQTLDEDVLGDLGNVIDDDTEFTDDQKDKYKDIIKSNYQKMTYKVKNEEIDGDNAIVTVEIDVIDYTKGLEDIEDYYAKNPDEFRNEEDENDNSLYTKYKLDKIKEIDDRTTYTIDFSLSKVNKEWTLDNPSSDIRDKINGIYK